MATWSQGLRRGQEQRWGPDPAARAPQHAAETEFELAGESARVQHVAGTRKRPGQTTPADVAQLVEHHLAKVRVASSNLVVRSEWGFQSPRAWWSGREARQRPAKPSTRVQIPSPPRTISSAGERFPDTEEVTGSIPVSSTGAFTGPSRAISSAGERFPDTEEVTGSIPVSRTQSRGRLAQRESASLTRKRSLVQSQYRPHRSAEGRSDQLRPSAVSRCHAVVPRCRGHEEKSMWPKPRWCLWWP